MCKCDDPEIYIDCVSQEMLCNNCKEVLDREVVVRLCEKSWGPNSGIFNTYEKWQTKKGSFSPSLSSSHSCSCTNPMCDLPNGPRCRNPL